MAVGGGDAEPPTPWRCGEGTRSPSHPNRGGGGDSEPLMVVGWAGLHGEKDLKRGLAGPGGGGSILGSQGRKLGCTAKLAGCSPGRGGQDGEHMSWAVTVFKCVLLPGPHLQQAPALTSL